MKSVIRSRAYYYIAQTHAEVGQNSEADENFLKATKFSFKIPLIYSFVYEDILFGYARFLVNIKKFLLAEQQLKLILQQLENFPFDKNKRIDVFVYLAMVQLKQRKINEAIDSQRSACEVIKYELIEQHELYVEHLRTLANYYKLARKINEAVEVYQYIMEVRKMQDPVYQYKEMARDLNMLGLIYLQGTQHGKAIQVLEEAMKIDKMEQPKSAFMAQTFNNLGMVYHAKANLKKAQMYFQKAIDIGTKLKEK